MNTIKLSAYVTAMDVSKARHASKAFSIISYKATKKGVILKFIGELPLSLATRID